MLAPELSDAEREFRDRFVTEYFKDYDFFAATIRMGFSQQYAGDYAKKMMFDPYVRKKIADAENALDHNADPEAQKKEVFKLLKREAVFNGHGSSHAARVSALGKLADFLGMEAPKKTQSEVTVNGGIQFYIPHNGRDPLPEPAKSEEKAA